MSRLVPPSPAPSTSLSCSSPTGTPCRHRKSSRHCTFPRTTVHGMATSCSSSRALGRGQFGLLGAGRARHLTGVDQFLATPDIDRLVADAQVRSYLRDRTPGGDQIRDLRRNSSG